VDDNSIEDIEVNNIEAIEDNIMGVIDDGVMGHVEDGDRMGVGDYRIILVLGTYNNVETMLNESSAWGMQSDNTEHSAFMSLGTAGIAGVLSHTTPSYVGNFKHFIFFPMHFNLPYLTLSLEMPVCSF
jgi:hypothetical protein